MTRSLKRSTYVSRYHLISLISSFRRSFHHFAASVILFFSLPTQASLHLKYTSETENMSTMLQIRDLLNPVTPEPSDASSDEAGVQVSPGRIAAGSAPVRHPREWSSKPGKQRGPVNFMPFEEGLSPEMVQQIAHFQVRPFGQIRQSCEHIPYNSSKKDFFEKTGRESIDGKFRFFFSKSERRYAHHI